MTLPEPFSFVSGTLPLLISIPHAGVTLTPEVENALTPEAAVLSDTDWHIPRLYDFARKMGASMLKGNYSRLVIDLNRPADDQPLYTTATTGLFPETLFDGRPVFKTGQTPTPQQRQRYLREIWHPYHQQLQRELDRLRAAFGYVLLFDAHSIASLIPRLFDGRLPDLNIGTNGGASCAPQLEAQIIASCAAQNTFSYVVNGRFKGGYITREYGKPALEQHAIQLELAQKNYMQEEIPFDYQPDNAAQLQGILQPLIATLLEWGSQQKSLS
ncbi:N-formylglutamate deformylase [Edaphovirga cremea]|uniref:N-formylglutamate deformylase n=1 Tax=Edaphovirga cremea TaxID=2267246 RepID=UPI003989F79E